MKKLSFSLFALLFSFSVMATGGNDKDSKKDQNPGNTYNALSQSSPEKTAASPNFPGGLVLDLGFNFLTDEPEDMELNFFGSKIFNIYYMYEIQLGNSHFSFNPGIGVGLEKYRFDKDVTLASENGETVIVPLTEEWDVKNSKLAVNYFDIPLELRFHLNKDNFRKSFKIGVGGKVGVLFDSHSKIKYETDGDKKIIKSKEQFGLSRFRYGVLGRIGIGSFSLFYYQELSTLFKDGEGPEDTTTAPFKIGISLYAF